METFRFEKIYELYNQSPKTTVRGKEIVFLTDDTKAYINKFFFTTNLGVYFYYDHSEGSFQQLPKDSLNDVYLNKLPEAVKKYFYQENFKIYKTVMNTSKPRIYDNNLNLFNGFIHPNKPYQDYPQEVKNKVQLFINFMKEVLSSNVDEVLNYLLKWCSNVVKGNKNTSVLYLKGIEGIGKSTFSEFIQQYVIGRKNSTESDAEPLRSPYNKELCGKLLVVFEELPVFSDKEWEGVSSKLKKSVTSNMENYSDKYEKRFTCENLNNYIINTNVEALKHSEGRRYFLLDVSTHRKQDYEYFGKIKEECFNNLVGEAFYNYLRELDTTNFNPQMMPETRSKQDAVYDRLDYVYRFLKDEYLFKNKSVICTLVDLFGNYQNYCSKYDRKPYTKTNFTKKLREIGKDYYQSKGQNRYSISLEELKELADKHKWIHDLDEYSVNEDEQDDNETLSYPQLIEINKQLRKRIKQLEIQNNSLNLLAVNQPVFDKELVEEINIESSQLKFNYQAHKLKTTVEQKPLGFNYRAGKPRKTDKDIEDEIMSIFEK